MKEAHFPVGTGLTEWEDQAHPTPHARKKQAQPRARGQKPLTLMDGGFRAGIPSRDGPSSPTGASRAKDKIWTREPGNWSQVSVLLRGLS